MYRGGMWCNLLPDPQGGHAMRSTLHELPAASVPAGRRFEPVAERALEPIVMDLAARLPGNAAGVLATAQFPGPAGIADLVAVTRAQEFLCRRLEVGIPALNSLADASVLAAVPLRRVASAMDISKTTGMSPGQVTRRLRSLRGVGAVTECGDGYRRDPALVPIGRMYAFETKVSDWSRGVAQALRYARWADAAGIVLLNAPKNIEGLHAHGRALRIGVAIGRKWLVRPVLQPVSPGLRLLASEMFVAALMKEK